MSRHGDITLPFGSEDRLFRLGLGQIRAIEEKCDAGLPELAARLAPMIDLARLTRDAAPEDRGGLMMRAVAAGALGRWRVDDYREPIYQGLVGAGVEPTLALILVKQTVDEAPPMASAVTAFQIIMASLVGPKDEPVGEPSPAGARKRRRSRAARPAGPTSTPAAR